MADAKPHARLPPLELTREYKDASTAWAQGFDWSGTDWTLVAEEQHANFICRTMQLLESVCQQNLMHRQLLQEREACIKAEAALEAAALRLEGSANLYEVYAKNPREDTDIAAMLRSAVDYREAARLVRNNTPKEQQ